MIFDPVQICGILNEECVDYVVVGGFAAVVRGSSLPTRDIAIVPSRVPENLERLARALTRMNAEIRIAGDSVPTKIDGAFLTNMPFMLNLVTDFGEMDLTFAPAGRAGGYDGWRAGATLETISDGVIVVVASLDDVIDSKQTANRAKDQMALPYLESLRDELRRRSGEIPNAITMYQAAHDRKDVAAALVQFALDASVVDDGRTYDGIDGVETFLRKAGSEYTYTRALISAEEVTANCWRVTNRLEGNFPGGQVDLSYEFHLESELIKRLTIAP